MSTPPSFAPDPARRRPGAGPLRKVGHTEPAISSASVEQSAPVEQPSHSDAPIDAASASVLPPSFAPMEQRSRPTAGPSTSPATTPHHGRSSSDNSSHVSSRTPKAAHEPASTVAASPAAQRPEESTAQPNTSESRRSILPRSTQNSHADRAHGEVSAQSSSQAMPPAYAPRRTNAPSYQPRHDQSFASSPGGATAHQKSHESTRPHTAPRWNAPRFPHGESPRKPTRRRRSALKITGQILGVFLVVSLAWVGFLLWDANTNLGRTDALSSAANTEGTTYLLAGSDSRGDGTVQDGFEGGERSDAIVLVNVAPNGQAVAISIPRDTYAEIPEYGWDKINSSYAYGGSALLVQSVEKLTGLTVDHYVQVGMGGVSSLVDAVGGINLCYDATVEDPYSNLNWTAGCHDVDGATALAFSRMRYEDPQGDIGRTQRQRQVISQVISAAVSPSTLLNPAKTLRVERAGSSSFTVDHSSNVFDVARMVMAFRSASHHQLMGVPPIASMNYTTNAGASAILLEDETAPEFFAKLRAGTLTPGDLNQIVE